MSNRLYPLLAQHRCWTHRKHFPLSPQQRYWLCGSDSLTKQLTAFANGDFRVRVLREYRARPYAHEAKKLSLPYHLTAFIREVELCCEGKPTVFARSVMPLSAMKGTGLQLAHLGNTPLGHLLFQRATVDIEQRELARIDTQTQTHWARRTLYEFAGSPILVSEFFLEFDGLKAALCKVLK